MQNTNSELNDTSGSKEENVSTPIVNMSETGKSYQITVPVPTFSKDDVRIDLVDNKLVIESKNRLDIDQTDIEKGIKTMFREFELPANADPSKIKAQMQNGILSVCITKRKEE
ncbi:MAG: Hsp20/alpha crystallin family protein [Salinivirgaceae bacterium]|nr:Hsp20/alpha crystallin family protein [Salinivirgaceae bacterium]MDD4747110.1 Hsp20/alpha crystallin family protein [Salinivirgaceae bacterium]MDY0281086.1 Hsp20/alpha crystallin family protein [Salinivirgaceae bacterium]